MNLSALKDKLTMLSPTKWQNITAVFYIKHYLESFASGAHLLETIDHKQVFTNDYNFISEVAIQIREK